MESEKISDRVTSVTRSILERGLNNIMFILTMTIHAVNPRDIEIIVKDILEYLDKTKLFEDKKETEA